jgi:hypothetical protein
MKKKLLKKTKVSKTLFTTKLGELKKRKTSSATTSSSSLSSCTTMATTTNNAKAELNTSATPGRANHGDISNNKKRKLKVTESDLDDDSMQMGSGLENTNNNNSSLNTTATKKIKLEKDDTNTSFDLSNNTQHCLTLGSKAADNLNASSDIKAEPQSASKRNENDELFALLNATNKVRLNSKKRFVIKKINTKLNKNIKKIKLKYKFEEKKLRKTFNKFPFQQILFDYLEFKAPCIPDNLSSEQASSGSNHDLFITCTNLINLFYMFINCKIFSHDRFVTGLISRGETFKNNLNDIKRPLGLLVNRSKSMMPLSSQHQGPLSSGQHGQMGGKLSGSVSMLPQMMPNQNSTINFQIF